MCDVSRVMLERVSQGPEAPRDHQDFLEPALGTTQYVDRQTHFSVIIYLL